jgi:ABC-2 type transport system permease protein
MFGVFFRMMKDKFNTMLIYSLSSIAFLEMYIATFPYVQKQADSFNQMVKSLPKEMFSALGIDPSQLSYSNLQSYLATEMFSFMWPILAIIFCTSLANYSIAGEIEKGDIELTLAQPVSRTKILVEIFCSTGNFYCFCLFFNSCHFPTS